MFLLYGGINEIFKNFIRRIKTEMAFLKSHSDEQPDYVLSLIVKLLRYLVYSANRSYEFTRNQLSMVLPNPAQGVGGGNSFNSGVYNNHGRVYV